VPSVIGAHAGTEHDYLGSDAGNDPSMSELKSGERSRTSSVVDIRDFRSVVRRPVTAGVATMCAAIAATLVGEAVWVVRRALPTQVEPGPSPIPARDGTPLRVVALGDSTLTGPGLEHDRHIWLHQALDRLGHHRPIELISLAVGGSRVVDVLERVPETLDLVPDLVVVAVGANDALHGTPIRRVRSRLHRLLDELLDGAPIVAVANVGNLGNIARLPVPLKTVVGMRALAVCSAIEDVVATHDRAVLLDVRPADHVLRDRTVYTPDLFHPGAIGHSAWADAALAGLRRAVEHVDATIHRTQPSREASFANG
jgi:lysophospholipase L1-like esterase